MRLSICLYITHEDGRMSKYEYKVVNGYHLLVSASAIEKHVDQQPDKKLADVTYKYSNTNAIDGLPHCITHATVTGTKDGTTLTAANVSYTYGNHMALVKDEISGKTLRYHFNDDGNQVSVDDELGYAMYTRYDRTDDNANAPINHATERSRMQRVVRNLLLDPMCEENSSVWEKSSTGTITRDQSTRQFGLVSYRLTIWSSDCVYVRQAVTLTPGKSYTLSGYVRSGGPRGVMRVAYTVGGQEITLDSEPGKVWEKTDNMPYERVSVSFTLPENAEPKVYCMAYCDMADGFAGGSCWFDAMQLEEGLTLNHFNMVQNSDFSVTGTDGKPKAWTVGKNDASYVEVLPLDAPKDEFHAPECLKHDNTQKIRLAGRYDRTVTYYQQFRHYGKIGDRFTVGGWCSSFAKKNDPDNYIYCRITVLFTAGNPDNANCYWATGGSAVFNAEEGNWQFASAGIVAPNNCTYIRVVLQMNRQMNFADFTGIYLYPEAFGTQYIYDKNGNRKTRKMLYGGQEKSEFDDADNLTKHTAAGRTVSSTFSYGDTEAEQKKHLLLKSIAPLGSVGTFTYDAFGNPLTSQVQNADTNPSYFIRGETSYTNDGNYVTEQKDARGKIVRTEIDPERGTTTSVTDAKGQTVTYEYDNLRRIVKTSANVGAEEGILTAHNEYTYDAQRGNLVEIRHNTDGNAANDVVYSFEQDALGRQTAVKVGNQTTGTLIHSATICRMHFPPSAAYKNLDLPQVNLRFLQLRLTKNSSAIWSPHLCGVTLIGEKNKMQYVGVFSAVMSDQCPKYRGIYRNNDLLDFDQNADIGAIIQDYFCNSHEGIYKKFSWKTLASVTELYHRLSNCGWKGDMIFWSNDNCVPSGLHTTFLGIDICGNAGYYSPLGDGFLQSYEKKYSFYSELTYKQFQTYKEDINEYGLFTHDNIGQCFAFYCNQISRKDSHAIENEKNWHQIYIFRINA